MDGTVTETRGVKVSYTQEWSSYNAAQTTEKENFVRLLRDLCATVATPQQQGAGNRRLPWSDMIFSSAFKVYSTVSARRFMCDLRDAEHRGLVERAPRYNSIFDFMQQEEVTPVLHDLITASSLPLREVETTFAVDSTGFGTSRYYRYYSEKYGHEQLGRAWVKTHAMVGTKTNIVTAVKISGMNEHDSPQFPELVEHTAQNFTMDEVSADKAYSGRSNYALVEQHGAVPFIPFRSNAKADPKAPTWNKMFHYFAMNREEFCQHYHRRSNVEATFSMIKRVFGDSVRAKTPVAQENEVLLKVLCHNIRVLIHEMYELGVAPLLDGVCPAIPAVARQLVAV